MHKELLRDLVKAEYNKESFYDTHLKARGDFPFQTAKFRFRSSVEAEDFDAYTGVIQAVYNQNTSYKQFVFLIESKIEKEIE